MDEIDPALRAVSQAPILLVFVGLGTTAIASSVRGIGQVQFAALLGPANAACCLAAVALILWRSRAAQPRGGYLVAAALAASLAADVLSASDELYGPLPSGATASALPYAMLDAPTDAALRALARALYAAACARWMADLQPLRWANAGALVVLPAAAAIACAQQALGEAATAAAAAPAALARLGAPVGLERDPRYAAACVDAVGAVALASMCTLRVLAARLAPAPRRAPPGRAAGTSIVPASQASADAARLLQRLSGLYPLAVVAGLALVAALGALRFPTGRRVNASWLASIDWRAHADGCRALLDAAGALTIARLWVSRVLDEGGGDWGDWSSTPTLADMQAERARLLRERRARAPVLQDAADDDDGWLAGHGPRVVSRDPNLIADDDGDLAHEFWRALPTGGFERAHAAAAK